MRTRFPGWTMLFCLLLLPPAMAMATPLSPTSFQNLTPERGFGDPMNRYAFSMAEFNDDVFVGTWNVQLNYPRIFQDVATGDLDLTNIQNPLNGIRYLESKGGEIWRNTGGQTWSKVDVPSTPNDTGFRKMIEYDGWLYAGSANSADGTKLYRSRNGTNWEAVTGGPTDVAANNSNRTMLVKDGYLYVGTENNETGGQLWRYSDGSQWEKVGDFPEDSSVSELAMFDGDLYVGTWDFTDSFSLYRMTGPDAFENITPTAADHPELAGLSNLGVMKLVEFQGQLYLGTVNYRDGFTLMRSTAPGEPASWEILSTDGFGDRSNAYTWAITEWNGRLFLGTFHSGLFGGQYGPLPLDGRAELWCSVDGGSWDLLMDDGFGSRFTYGIRNILATDEALYFGTASNFFIYDPASLAPYLSEWMAQMNLTEEQARRLYGFFAHLGTLTEGDWIGTEVYALPHSAPVPEPATLTLVGLGLLGAGAGACRRRKRTPLS